VAKAVVLEAMRTAHAQRRPCHVFAFGGPEELLEMEVAGGCVSASSASSRFLGQAFRGGTDICGPLEAAIAKLEDTRWQLADLLIASDGEFGATPRTHRAPRCGDQASARPARAGRADRRPRNRRPARNRRHIYPVRDWRRYGGLNMDAPIPTHRLTAMFFPGALRNAANREATVDGAAASAIVRAGRPHDEP
jgi:hypothetical protein